MRINQISSPTFNAKVYINDEKLFKELAPTQEELKELAKLTDKARSINDNREISLWHGCFFEITNRVEYSNYKCGLYMDESGKRSKLSDVVYKICEFHSKDRNVKDEKAFSTAILEPLRNLYG